MSERELQLRMAAAGRPVSMLTISEWRRCRLMPRLSTRSRGLNKGKICYWAEEDTLGRAALIYDLLEAGSERHEVYWLLWLCGFDIALPQLRRAWLHKERSQSEPRGATRCSADDPPSVAPPGVLRNVRAGIVSGGAVPGQSILDVVLNVNAAMNHRRQPEIEALIDAFESSSVELDAVLGTRCGDRDAVIGLVKTVWSGLRTSDMIIGSTTEDLREARDCTSTALRFFHSVAQEGAARRSMRWPGWPIDEARAFGAPLFFLALALLKSGQRALIEHTVTSATAAEANQRVSQAR